MGQSNAGGVGSGSGMGLSAAYSAVQYYEETAGAGPADPPVFTTEGPRDLAPRLVNFSGSFGIGSAGVELALGRYLAENTTDTWYLAKFSIDGSSLVNNWAAAGYPSTGGNMLARTIAFIDAQIARWSITDVGSNLILYWIQGTADGGQTYAAYKAGMETFFDGLRAQYSNCRVIVNRTIDVVDTAANVRAAQEAYVIQTNGCGIVGRDDFTLRDTAHYSDTSYVDLGNALGAKTVDLLNGVTPSGPFVRGTGPFKIATSAQALALTMPPHKAGDYAVIWVAGIGPNNYLPPSGWSSTGSSPQHDSGATTNARLHAFYQVAATDNGIADPTVADVAGDGSKIACVQIIGGASSIATTNGDTAATSTSVSVPGATPTSANALAVGACAACVDTNTPQFSDWTNGDLTELLGQVNFATSSGSGINLGTFSGRRTTASAFGATTATLSATSTQARITLVFES